MILRAGDTIDQKYRILRVLGEGGMGSVYEAENVAIRRRVAIKVLHAAVAPKADAVQRFEREAQAAGRIGSEHIVEVLDLGSLDTGQRYMVMEFLDGESLGERIRRKERLSPREVAPLLVQLLDGLAAAHQAGIVHRDLKPDNVFLVQSRGGTRDFVKILDFGVSKFAAEGGELISSQVGTVMGTPYYMSPEQARGQEVDARSDIYSAGVVGYQAVTGSAPFQAATFNELFFKIALEAPEPAELLVPDLDPGFASMITRAMARDPAERFQTAQEFHAVLSAWMNGEGVVLGRSSVTSLPPPGRVEAATDIGLAKTVEPGDEVIAPIVPVGPSRRRMIAIGAVGVAGLALCAAAAYRMAGSRARQGGPPPAVSIAPVPAVSASVAPMVTVEPGGVAAPTVSAEPAVPRPLAKTKPSAAPSAKATTAPSVTATTAPTEVPVVPAGRTINGEL